MRQGWRCPVCGIGVSPDARYCAHPPQPQPLPDDFPTDAMRAAAKAAFPALDIEREARKFRSYYAGQVTMRWEHVWRRWLEREAAPRPAAQQRPAAAAAMAPDTDKVAEAARRQWIKVKRVDDRGRVVEVYQRRGE